MTLTAEDHVFINYVARSWRTDAKYFEKSPIRQKGSLHNAISASIEGMSRRYDWRGEDFASSRHTANQLADRLRNALEQDKCHELHHQCLAILEWGGLAGVSSAWVRESCSSNLLRIKLQRAVALLQTGTDFTEFDGENLIMNSGLTKVYAMAAPDDIIIYDGRVGAALGLLVRRSFGSTIGTVPEGLKFPWGSGQGQYSQRAVSSRNPSRGSLVFPYFDSYDASHAKWCHKASVLLKEACKQLTPLPSLRELEMGLFMIGYAVNGVD